MKYRNNTVFRFDEISYNQSMKKDTKTNHHAAIKVRSGIKAGKGLGDRVADFTHFTGIDQLALKYTECTGKDCGCEERRVWLNELYPG